MKSRLLLYSFLLLSFNIHAQGYNSLNLLPGQGVTTYFSSGQDKRAKQIAARVEKVISYYSNLIKFKPSVSLLILSKADWSNYTQFPVYGMPHYNSDTTLVIAAEDNEFWRSQLPLEVLPGDIRNQAKRVYGLPDSSVSLQAFFDLLAIHELGHAFHQQAKLQMQRKWMGELFCNILLHTYIAEKEPDQLPALTLFPKIVVLGGTKFYQFTTLQAFEEKYVEIAQQHPRNYGWYQCRLHVAAASIYDAEGKAAFERLWKNLNTEQAKLDDTSLAELLQTKVGKTVADVMLRWEIGMVR